MYALTHNLWLNKNLTKKVLPNVNENNRCFRFFSVYVKKGYPTVWRWKFFFTNFYYFQECEPRVIISEILFHEWNEFHIYRQTIEFSVYYIFLVFFNMFLSNLRHFVQNMTWRHNCLLSSSQCENNSQWRYNFYFTDKTRYFMIKNVCYIHTCIALQSTMQC